MMSHCDKWEVYFVRLGGPEWHHEEDHKMFYAESREDAEDRFITWASRNVGKDWRERIEIKIITLAGRTYPAPNDMDEDRQLGKENDMNEWRNIDDQFPETTDDVLVYVYEEEAPSLERYEFYDIGYWVPDGNGGGSWRVGDTARRLARTEHVTHWMPLPKRPGRDIS